ncbi:hypothetical protein [Kitasatospora terrestris]
MSAAIAGLLTGIALGFAGFFGGFWAFLLVAVLGAVGLFIGWLAESDTPIGDMFRTRSRR